MTMHSALPPSWKIEWKDSEHIENQTLGAQVLKFYSLHNLDIISNILYVKCINH